MSLLERLARLENAVGLDIESDSEPEDDCWGCEEDDQPGMLVKLVPGCPVHTNTDADVAKREAVEDFRERARARVIELRRVSAQYADDGSSGANERCIAYDNVLRFL